MPVIDVEENINQTRTTLARLSQEMAQLQGVLKTFEGFKRGGLKTINLPKDPTSLHDVDEPLSIQAKPE